MGSGNDFSKLRALLEQGEQLMNGSKRALDLGKLATDRVKLRLCAACGKEEVIEGLPLGPDCAKQGASSLIDLLCRRG